MYVHFFIYSVVKIHHYFTFRHAKINEQEIPSMRRIVLELFSDPLYIEYLSLLYRKFQVASTYDTNVECQILRFCCNSFLSYADNRHTDQTLKM